MSTTPKFFAAGSRAKFAGVSVRIHQLNTDGTALIFGPSLSRRVEVADLEPIPGEEPFPRWIEERIASTGQSSFTPTFELFEDFRRWSEENDASDFRIYSRISFERFLHAYGMTQSVRRTGMFSRAGRQFGYCITLREPVAVAA
jgi:hypothetical protein